ncbi:MAG: fumarylacetoacetate hydrolase family protein [Planctomycetes bacterium]|nr:fumarylacetoacetate hydrolase family protein [Planctomycetota bacterium]
MILYKTAQGPVVEHDGRWFTLPGMGWDELVNLDDLAAVLRSRLASATPLPGPPAGVRSPLAPIGSQEVWAAGVTYHRSRTARMDESQKGGGSDFYDRVYHADRPELFFKASPHRVAGPGQPIHRRRDSRWVVPEPELTLAVTRSGKIIGYTIGNDVSCRDIEGENPLYLPQAKVFDRCVGLGPGLLVSEGPLPDETQIRLEIRRGGEMLFTGATTAGKMRKKPPQLVEYLFREDSFPSGCLLLTGTGVVPPDDFTLESGDEVIITIDPIGTLVNPVD